MKFINTPGRLIKSEIGCDDGQMLPMQVVKLRPTLVSAQLPELSVLAPLALPIVLQPIGGRLLLYQRPTALSCFQTESHREILESPSYPGFALEPPARLQSILHITCQSPGAAVSPQLWIMQQRRLKWRHGTWKNTNKDVQPRRRARRKSRARVCSGWLTVSIIGRNRRQFRVTCADTDCSRGGMTTKVALGSRQVFEGRKKNSKEEEKRKNRSLATNSEGNAGVRSLRVLLILPQWWGNTSFSVTSRIVRISKSRENTQRRCPLVGVNKPLICWLCAVWPPMCCLPPALPFHYVYIYVNMHILFSVQHFDRHPLTALLW